jgi:hypothetical protein
MDQLIFATNRRLKRKGVVHDRQTILEEIDFAGQSAVRLGNGEVRIGSLLENRGRARLQSQANKTRHETREMFFEETPHAFE